MSRVHGVLHRLQPIAVEHGLDVDAVVAVLAHPEVELRERGNRLRAQVGPVKIEEAMNRVRLLADRETEHTVCWLGRRFATANGSQYRRMRSPAGVPGPIRVRNSFSSAVSMQCLLVAARIKSRRESIANTAHRLDATRTGRFVLDLLAQTPDMDRDRARI